MTQYINGLINFNLYQQYQCTSSIVMVSKLFSLDALQVTYEINPHRKTYTFDIVLRKPHIS